MPNVDSLALDLIDEKVLVVDAAYKATFAEASVANLGAVRLPGPSGSFRAIGQAWVNKASGFLSLNGHRLSDVRVNQLGNMVDDVVRKVAEVVDLFPRSSVAAGARGFVEGVREGIGNLGKAGVGLVAVVVVGLVLVLVLRK